MQAAGIGKHNSIPCSCFRQDKFLSFSYPSRRLSYFHIFWHPPTCGTPPPAENAIETLPTIWKTQFEEVPIYKKKRKTAK